MAVNTYECLFLLDPNKATSDLDGAGKHVNGLIERHGGEIMVSRPWGDTKLAYPIRKFRKGIYFLTYFKADARKIPEFEDDCRISDLILRHMVIRLHPRLVDDLLAHLNNPQPAHREEEVEGGRPERGGRGERGDRERRPRDRDRGDRDRAPAATA